MMLITRKKLKYAALCQLLDQWTAVVNPCEIAWHNGKYTCVNYPEGNEGNLLCCGVMSEKSDCNIFNKPCKHHGKNGCKVQSLSCKMWFCEKAWNNLITNHTTENTSGFIQVFQYVSQICRLHFIPAVSRHSKKENFEKAKKIFK